MLSGSGLPHISVCACTYKRPDLLVRLLASLAGQETEGKFTFSVVIADNDGARSGEAVARKFEEGSGIPVRYCVESRQGIALARNKAVESADGDFVSFIDDDEFATPRWLLTLFDTLHRYGADGSLGPVKPHFDVEPPRWVVKGGFYDRPSYPTGLVIDWRKGRTGNVLLRREVFGNGATLFRPEFRTGEDQDFFRRAIDKGMKFVWCHEALAYEVVPPMRWNITFLLKRALLRGATSLAHPTFGGRDVLKSLIAVPAYLLALPFVLIWGQGRFMSLLISLFDHLGLLLALVGIHPVKDQYVTE